MDVIAKQKADPRGVSLFQKPFTLLPVPLSPAGGLDLIFMPGLGFDKQGNRLGRGRGYYDTYLKRCLEEQDVRPYTMALAFREQICPQVPVDENDMKVDEVLYEEPST
nr:5-formyltetrahydrofolate cyclo-ligase [Mirounga angustirostris]